MNLIRVQFHAVLILHAKSKGELLLIEKIEIHIRTQTGHIDFTFNIDIRRIVIAIILWGSTIDKI